MLQSVFDPASNRRYSNPHSILLEPMWVARAVAFVFETMSFTLSRTQKCCIALQLGSLVKTEGALCMHFCHLQSLNKMDRYIFSQHLTKTMLCISSAVSYKVAIKFSEFRHEDWSKTIKRIILWRKMGRCSFKKVHLGVRILRPLAFP